jgi:hypothetical protein
MMISAGATSAANQLWTNSGMVDDRAISPLTNVMAGASCTRIGTVTRPTVRSIGTLGNGAVAAGQPASRP